MFKLLLLFSLLTLLSISSFAQVHVHGSDHHKKFEIGTAENLVYALDDKEFAPGFHFHGIWSVSEAIGIGAGYEGIFFENYHQAVTVFGQYTFHDFITLAAGPGIIFPNQEHSTASLIAHLELSAGFDLGKIHLGPSIGLAIGEEKHVSLGLHFGYHFK